MLLACKPYKNFGFKCDGKILTFDTDTMKMCFVPKADVENGLYVRYYTSFNNRYEKSCMLDAERDAKRVYISPHIVCNTIDGDPPLYKWTFGSYKVDMSYLYISAISSGFTINDVTIKTEHLVYGLNYVFLFRSLLIIRFFVAVSEVSAAIEVDGTVKAVWNSDGDVLYGDKSIGLMIDLLSEW